MRILLVKTSSLGDVVHNLPVATDLARQYPGATIDWLVEEAFTELPALHPAIQCVIPVAIRRWRKHLFAANTWREIALFRRVMHGLSYDAILDSQGLVKSALVGRIARHGERNLIGPDRNSAREPLAARFYDRPIAVPRDRHAVERNRLLAATSLGYGLDAAPDYGIKAPTLTAPWLTTGDYAVLLTATSRADKEWPEDDWQALGSALIATGLRCVLPAGNARERERAGRLATSLGRAIAAPPMNLTELAGLLGGARLVVGVDTGLVHLAAALGRPTIALYLASDPALTGVLAGNAAINLGAPGQPPSASEVVRRALSLV